MDIVSLNALFENEQPSVRIRTIIICKLVLPIDRHKILKYFLLFYV